ARGISRDRPVEARAGFAGAPELGEGGAASDERVERGVLAVGIGREQPLGLRRLSRLVQVRAEQRRGAFVVGADRNRAAQGLHRGAEPAGLAPQERELHRARLVSPPARVWGARARTASPPVSPGSGRGGTVL